MEQQGRLLSGLQRDRRRHTGRDGPTGGLRTQGTPPRFHIIIVMIVARNPSLEVAPTTV